MKNQEDESHDGFYYFLGEISEMTRRPIEDEDVGFDPVMNPNSLADLKLISFLKDDETYIDGRDLVRRARGELKANLGLHHMEYILEYQDLLPTEFRDYVLVFPGTILEDDFEDLFIPFLVWDDSECEWYPDFFCFTLGGKCGYNARLLSLNK